MEGAEGLRAEDFSKLESSIYSAPPKPKETMVPTAVITEEMLQKASAETTSEARAAATETARDQLLAGTRQSESDTSEESGNKLKTYAVSPHSPICN